MMGQCLITRRGGENLLVRDPIKFTNNKNGLYYGTISSEYTTSNILMIVFREKYDSIDRTRYYIVPRGFVVCAGGANYNCSSPTEFADAIFYSSNKAYSAFYNYLVLKPE